MARRIIYSHIAIVATALGAQFLCCPSVRAEDAGAAIVKSDAARDAVLTAGRSDRIVRLTARLQGNVAPRKNGGPYLPHGIVTIDGAADPVFGDGQGQWDCVILSNADGEGGFVTREGKIEFMSGSITFKGVFPTHNDPTPIEDLRQTAMVEKVTGGTGSFEGASGYLLFLSSLEKNGDIRATFAGMLFVRK